MSAQNPTDQRGLLTIDDVAEWLNCSSTSVRRAISRGEIKAVRVGKLIRIRPADVERKLRPVTRLGSDR